MLFKNIKIIDENFKAREGMHLRTKGAFITYIGEEEPEALSGEEIYEGGNKVLLPAFYNTHCHVPMTLLRGYGEGLPLSRWLNERIFPFEAKLDAEAVYWGTKLGAMELMAAGSASISDMYFFVEDMARSLYEAGMKANISHGLSSFNPNEKLKELKGYKDTLSLDAAVREGAFGGEKGGRKGSRIIADMGLHAEYTTTENFVRQVAGAAKEEDMMLHTHISETMGEHEECKGRHGGRTPVQYFRDLGVFENPVRAAHCVYLEDEDVNILKESGAYAVHNPSSNMKLGSGIMPLKKYVQAGLSLGLGTDGASSNNNLDMMEEIHMAAMLSRAASLDANAVSPADVLKMATVNGAKAQGRDDCGLIKEGYRADLIIINLDTPHMQPDFDTVSNLVFAAQSGDIVLNMIDGNVVYKDGEYSCVDKEKTIYEAVRCFRKILAEV